MNPDRNYRLAQSKRDTIGMCDALLDTLVPSRVEARVGGVEADSGPIDTHAHVSRPFARADLRREA